MLFINFISNFHATCAAKEGGVYLPEQEGKPDRLYESV